jgi:phosphoenolpyruvate mutase
LNNKKIVYVGMAADIIHNGHVNILKHAESYGRVVVGLLSDSAISTYKNSPILNYEQRFSIVSNLKGVSEVIKQETLDYTENLKKIKPDYVVHGDDWKSGVQLQTRKKVIEVLKEIGGELIEVPYTEGVSSSYIKNQVASLNVIDERRSKLRQLLDSKTSLRFIDTHNALTALIAEKTQYSNGLELLGYDGFWASSLTDSTIKGKPDIEAVDTTSRLTTLNEIIEVTTKPIIYDGDTGGKKEHLRYTIRNLERIGVSSIIIEDKTGLKRNSLLGTEVEQTQDSIENFSEKLIYAKESKKFEDFYIFARIESLILNKPLEDAINRSEAYIDSGADGIMIHSKEKNPESVFRFIEYYKAKYSSPLVVVPTTYNDVTFNEFEQLGVNIIIYANHLLRASFPAMSNVAKNILKFGRTLEIENQIMSIKEILNLIEIEE